jgi:hypothetical protein
MMSGKTLTILALACACTVAAFTIDVGVGAMAQLRDLRAPVTQQQLDEYFAAEDFYYWGLPVGDNERLKGKIDWFDPNTPAFQLLTRPQQVLILVGMLDGDILNGGIGQLFFNYAPRVPAMQEALEEMGCSAASQLIDRELDRLAEVNFIPRWLEARAVFADKSNGTKEDWEQAWGAFMAFVDEMFPDDSASDAYVTHLPETETCIRKYIEAHTGDLFRITDVP